MQSIVVSKGGILESVVGIEGAVWSVELDGKMTVVLLWHVEEIDNSDFRKTAEVTMESGTGEEVAEGIMTRV